MKQSDGIPADPAAYVAANSLTAKEVEEVMAALRAAAAGSMGWFPLKAEVQDMEDDDGWPVCKFLDVRTCYNSDGFSWTIERRDGQLIVYADASDFQFKTTKVRNILQAVRIICDKSKPAALAA